MGRFPLSARRDRIVVVGVSAVCLGVVVWIAIPSRHGARTAHIASVRHQLDPECVQKAVEEADGGLRVIVGREHGPVADKRIDDEGRPTALYVTQWEVDGGWAFVVHARTVDDVPGHLTQQRFAERLTRDTAMYALRRCADRFEWDGGLSCERWASTRHEQCLGP